MVKKKKKRNAVKYRLNFYNIIIFNNISLFNFDFINYN